MSDDSPTVSELLKAATARLATSPSPRLDAEVLLAHALLHPRSWLIAWPEFRPDAEQLADFESLLARRAAGEPVAYLTGQREFWSLDLAVSPDVLIPRPDTELLVEAALAHLPAGSPLKIADLGTGSGAVALALAHERPTGLLIAIDRSAGAIRQACTNARRLEIRNVLFIQTAWLAPVAAHSLDLIVANPPYIAAHDPHLEQGDLRYEPRDALISGPEGLDDLTCIAGQAATCLKPGGWLLLEHGQDQGGAVRALLTSRGYRHVDTLTDLEDRGRVTLGQAS
ncbi:MAG: peptide chain release factor N(5)-glutamine methyltransferase [Gammaproteobacteria bacterium]|jgi:release factor glutamine methyltransferase